MLTQCSYGSLLAFYNRIRTYTTSSMLIFVCCHFSSTFNRVVKTAFISQGIFPGPVPESYKEIQANVAENM